jgi:hypothetical protein
MVLGLVMVAGCGNEDSDKPDLGYVRGTVTLDGKPLPFVTVYFKPDVGRQSIARANEEGYYEAMYLVDEKGVKVGPCTATVEWGIDDSGPAIPAKYGSQSELKLTVEPGKNTFDIAMDSK